MQDGGVFQLIRERVSAFPGFKDAEMSGKIHEHLKGKSICRHDRKWPSVSGEPVIHWGSLRICSRFTKI